MLAFLMCVLLASSLGSGSIAHANEPTTRIETSTASGGDHAQGDGDQVPADAEKAYPHHHGGCHGHHVGVLTASDHARHGSDRGMSPLRWHDHHTTGATAVPALRPPQA